MTTKTLTEWEVPDLKVDGLTGATAASRVVGATTSGAPASGTFAKGDVVVDQTGAVWVCTTAGSPGTWTRTFLGSVPSLLRSGQYTGTPCALSATTVTSNRLYYEPFLVSRATTFDRIGINHSATSAGASSVARVGIYGSSSTDDIPGSLILDAGTVDLSTAAAFKVITISQTLNPGLYWLAAVAQITSGSPQFYATGTMLVRVPDPSVNSGGIYFDTASVTSTLPSTASPSTTTATGGLAVFVRSA